MARNIDILIKSTYDGNGLRQARADAQGLAGDLAKASGKSTPAGAPGTVQTGAMATVQAQQAPISANNPLRELENNNRAHVRRVRTFQEKIERDWQNAANQNKAMDYSRNALLNTKGADIRRMMQTEGMTMREALRAHGLQGEGATNMARNVRREISVERTEERAQKAQMKAMIEAANLRRKFDQQDEAHWSKIAREKQQAIRVQETAARQSETAVRRASFDQRNQSGVDMIIGGALHHAGDSMMGFTSGNLAAFGRSQLTGVGVSTLEGANSGNVIAHAREQAKNTYGASYIDILNHENALVTQGTTREEAQKLVKNLSDINAAAGGTSATLQRVIYNLSQTESQGRLTGVDNRQFLQARINMMPYLAKQMGVEQSQVRDKISAGEVSSQMVRKAIYEMGNDPKFKDRGKIITETTLPGQFEKSAEEFEELRELLGEGLSPTVGVLNGHLRGLIETMKEKPALAKGLGLATGVGGVAATGAGTFYSARAFVGFLAASKMQVVAGETQLAAARMNLSRCALGGGAPGTVATGALSAINATAATTGAARVGIGARLAAMAGAPVTVGGTTFQSAALGSVGARGGAATMGLLTTGGAMASAGLGIGAGLGVHSDMKGLGASDGQAFGAAAATSLTAGLSSAFLPGGAIATALALGVRAAAHHFVIDPQERNATDDEITPDESTALSKMSPSEKNAFWLKKRDELEQRRQSLENPGLLQKGFENFGGLLGMGSGAQRRRELADTETEQQIAILNARTQRKLGRNYQEQTTQERESADWQAFLQASGVGTGPRDGADSGEISNRKIEPRSVRETPDGQIVTLVLPMHSRTSRVVSDIENATV